MARYQLRFHPLFVTDLENAHEYYTSQSKVAAKKFKAEIKKQLNRLIVNPNTRSVRYDDIRLARIEKFPYAIHFSIDQKNGVVLVQSLLSDYQDDAEYWKKRF